MNAKLLEILKKGWPYLAILVVGVGIGWYVKPDQVRVEEKTKIVEVVKEVVVTQEKVRVEVVHVKDTTVVERWHREKTEEKKPDGTVITKEVEDRNIDTLVKEKENSETVKVVEVVKEVVVNLDVVVEKVIEPVLHQWAVGLLVGVAPRFDNPASTPIMLGVSAERRILGPFLLGLQLQAGSPVTGFQVTNAALFVSGKMEF